MGTDNSLVKKNNKFNFFKCINANGVVEYYFNEWFDDVKELSSGNHKFFVVGKNNILSVGKRNMEAFKGKQLTEEEYRYEFFKLSLIKENCSKNVVEVNDGGCRLLYDKWFNDISEGYSVADGWYLTGSDYNEGIDYNLNLDGAYTVYRDISLPFNINDLSFEEYKKYFL